MEKWKSETENTVSGSSLSPKGGGVYEKITRKEQAGMLDMVRTVASVTRAIIALAEFVRKIMKDKQQESSRASRS